MIFRGSDDNGATFSTKTTLSPTVLPDDSDEPQITISGSTAHVVWEEDTPTSEVFLGVGISSGISISFTPSSNLKLDDIPTITVTGSDTSGAINVNVKSSTGDSSGFDLSLDEISSKTHSGTLSFSETLDSSQADRRLKANPGDTITVTFDSVEATTQIFPRTVTFDSNTYDKSLIANIEVTDQNSNVETRLDTVTVDVTSDADPSGISLVLTETGNNTGIFGGLSSSPPSQLIFFKNDGLIILIF